MRRSISPAAIGAGILGERRQLREGGVEEPGFEEHIEPGIGPTPAEQLG